MDLFDETLLNEQPSNIREQILESDQLKIYQHYVPSITLGMQKSPFYDDKRHSFSVYESEGKINWKDHGNGGGIYCDIFDFVQLWYETFKDKQLNFIESLYAIYYDTKLEPGQTVDNNIFFHSDDGYTKRKGVKENTHLDIKDIGWTNWAYSYWIDRYGITPQILAEYNVGHAKEVWYTKPRNPTRLWGVSTPEHPIFYFYFPISGNVKCYAPFGVAGNNNKKWINNANNIADVQGYHQLHIKERLPEIIIFTKAMKEVMFFRSLGLDAIAGHGESHMFTEDFVRHIRKYSRYQFSLYDSDWPGIKGAMALREKHNIPIALINGYKNVTDLWEKSPKEINKYADSYIQLKSKIWLQPTSLST